MGSEKVQGRTRRIQRSERAEGRVWIPTTSAPTGATVAQKLGHVSGLWGWGVVVTYVPDTQPTKSANGIRDAYVFAKVHCTG